MNSNRMRLTIKWVSIREDSLKTINEIADRLTDADIPNQVNLAPGCSTGSCSLRYIVVVPQEQVPLGIKIVEDYFLQLHPELQKSRELEEQGKCPACGYDNGHDARVCADCGLALIIEY